MNYVVIQPNHISEKIRVEISEKKNRQDIGTQLSQIHK